MRPGPDDIRIERLTDVHRVDVAPGFFAITRSAGLPEMLERILGLGAVVTAALHGSVLVGYAADLPFLPIVWDGGQFVRRWQRVPDARELGGIEVARPFRAFGLGRRLLAGMVADGRLDAQIVLGEGLHWHWDAEAQGLGTGECRSRLLQLFGSAGFSRTHTDEPEVAQSPWNFLIARVGPRVPASSQRAFEAALFRNGEV